MNFPAALKYTKDHEWILFDGNRARIGITDFAQRELGDIVYVEVKEPGTKMACANIFGTIEAVKTVSDLFMPVEGTIAAINPKLNEAPELINKDPYGDGWIMEIVISETDKQNGLMDAESYRKMVE